MLTRSLIHAARFFQDHAGYVVGCPHSVEIGSLCGIIDADNDYRRVIQAELALEGLTNA